METVKAVSFLIPRVGSKFYYTRNPCGDLPSIEAVRCAKCRTWRHDQIPVSVVELPRSKGGHGSALRQAGNAIDDKRRADDQCSKQESF